MSPSEILRGPVDDKTLKKIEKGGEVFGVLIYSEEVDSLVELQENLVEILTSGNPNGFHRTKKRQERWKSWRNGQIERYGEEALANLFPEEGHEQFTWFLSRLRNERGINTISQLIENQNRLGEIRLFGAGGKRGKAARLIIDFFESRGI